MPPSDGSPAHQPIHQPTSSQHLTKSNGPSHPQHIPAYMAQQQRTPSRKPTRPSTAPSGIRDVFSFLPSTSSSQILGLGASSATDSTAYIDGAAGFGTQTDTARPMQPVMEDDGGSLNNIGVFFVVMISSRKNVHDQVNPTSAQIQRQTIISSIISSIILSQTMSCSPRAPARQTIYNSTP